MWDPKNWCSNKIVVLYPQERVFGLVNQVARAHRPGQGWHEESAEEGSWKNWSHFHNHNSEEGNVLINRPLWIYPTRWTIHFEWVLTNFNQFLTAAAHHAKVGGAILNKRLHCYSLKWCHRVHHMETHGWQLRRGRQWCLRESQRAFHLPLSLRGVHRTQTLTLVSMP